MEGTDGLLAARLAAGDDEALGEALDRYGRLVFSSARRLTGDDHAAQDVVQEVFVALWRAPHRFDPARGSLATYLAVEARHRALDALRSAARRTRREQGTVADEPLTIDLTDAILRSGVVRDAVRGLPPPQRQVVELAYFAGLSYREVAEVLAIPEGTAKSRLRLALARLQSVLDRELLETS